MFPPRTKPEVQSAVRLTAAVLLAATVGGCSETNFDRHDTVSVVGGNAVAVNMAMQMNDPWPPHSGDTHLATNGQRMQSAVERYRNNIVTAPVDPLMLETANQTPPTAQSPNSTSSAPPPSIAPGSTTTTTTVVTAPPSP